MEVKGPRSTKAANRSPKRSQLQSGQTALFGGDANGAASWRRSDVCRRAHRPFPHQPAIPGVPMVRKDKDSAAQPKRQLTKVFKAKEFTILIDLAQRQSRGAHVDDGFVLRIRANQRELSFVRSLARLQNRGHCASVRAFRAMNGLSHRSPRGISKSGTT